MRSGGFRDSYCEGTIAAAGWERRPARPAAGTAVGLTRRCSEAPVHANVRALPRMTRGSPVGMGAPPSPPFLTKSALRDPSLDRGPWGYSHPPSPPFRSGTTPYPHPPKGPFFGQKGGSGSKSPIRAYADTPWGRSRATHPPWWGSRDRRAPLDPAVVTEPSLPTTSSRGR